MNKNVRSLLILVLVISISGLFGAELIFADSSGQVTVGSVASAVTLPKLLNVLNGDVNASSLNVKVEYWINATVTDNSTMEYLSTVKFVLWDSLATSENNPDSQVNHYTFTWTEAAGTWSSGPSGYLISANCSDPGSGSPLPSYVFRCAFLLSRVACEENATIWKVKITVEDDQSETTVNTDLTFGVSFYSELTAIEPTHDFSTLSPGDTNKPVIGQPLNISVLANNYYDTETRGDGSLQGQGAAAGHTIPLGSVKANGVDEVGEAEALTTNYALVSGLDTIAPPTDENAPITNRNVYLWITVPTPCYPGTYDYTLYIRVVLTVAIPYYPPEEFVAILYDLPSDGFTEHWGSDYNAVWTDTSSNKVENTTSIICVGQWADGSYYYINRGYLYFDTSDLPESAIITSASISLKGYPSGDGFGTYDLVVQNGMPTYPHDPLVVGDYDKSHYSGVGASFDTTNWNSSGFHVLVDNYSEVNCNFNTGLQSLRPSTTSSYSARAQSFVSPFSHILTSVKFYLSKMGLPTGYAHAVLYAHSGTYGLTSKPSGEVLATSDDFDVSELTTNASLITFTFSGAQQYVMQANTYYCIAFENPISGTIDINNCVIIGGVYPDQTHSGNTGSFQNTVWDYYLVDTIFYVYGDSVEGTLNTIPLNSEGIGWINKTGGTKFALRSSQDISGTAPPSGTNYSLYFVSREDNHPSQIPYLTITYTVPPSLTITSTAGGTTNPVPNTYSYSEATPAEVLAIPSEGYYFYSWLIDDTVYNNTNPITILVDHNGTLHAIFEPVEVAIVQPENITYLPSIPVQITAVPIGGIDKIWYNCKNGTQWIYPSNQTYTTTTNMLGFNGGTYTFYAWANDTEGYEAEETVIFSVDFALADGAVYSDYYADWSWARNNASGLDLDFTSDYGSVWAEYYEPDYDLGRVFLYFDTSYLPDNAVITSAKLSLYCATWDEGTPVRFIAQKGTQADILTVDDYSAFSGGEYGHSDAVISSQYNDLTFNSLGMSEINRAGITRICVREYDHDFLDSAPTGWEHGIDIAMAEAGEGYQPKLVVTYTLPTLFEYNNEYDSTVPSYGLVWLGQTFTPQTSHNLSKVVLSGFSEGNPNGNFIVSIRETENGLPIGDDLVVKAILASSIPPYSETPIEIVFDTQILLNAGTKYAIVVRCPDGNVEQRITLVSSSENPYPQGEKLDSENGGETWNLDVNFDFWFEEWGLVSPPMEVQGWTITESLSSFDDEARRVAVDASGIYLVGWDSIPGYTEWRIEKRSLSDGSLIWSQTEDPTGEASQAFGVAVDSSGVYVVGSEGVSGNPVWRMEKRSLTDGSLIWARVESLEVEQAFCVAVDGSGIYVAGYDTNTTEASPEWRIEKLSLDGSSIWNQTDASGIYAFGITIDGSGIYLAGMSSEGWLTEKRSLTDGSIMWSISDASGIIAWDVAVDGSGVYTVGVASGNVLLIEKRSLTDGSSIWNQTENSSGDDLAHGVAVDGSGIYISGHAKNSGGNWGWLIEKRSLSDGSGIWRKTEDLAVDYNNEAWSVAVDGSGVYVAGYSMLYPGSEWHIEKRSLADGSMPVADVTLECWGFTETADHYDYIEIDGEVYSVTFDRYEDSIPVFTASITLNKGSHSIRPYPSGYGGCFQKWETLGDISVFDPNSESTTLTINGNGTLRLYIIPPD